MRLPKADDRVPWDDYFMNIAREDMCKHESVLSKDWVDGYVGHHENNEPEKYGSMKATVLRPLNIKE